MSTTTTTISTRNTVPSAVPADPAVLHDEYKRGINDGKALAQAAAAEIAENAAKRIARGKAKAKELTDANKAERINAIITKAAAETEPGQRQRIAATEWLTSGTYEKAAYSADKDQISFKTTLLRFEDLDKAYREDPRAGRLYFGSAYAAKLEKFALDVVKYTKAQAASLAAPDPTAPKISELKKSGAAVFAEMFGPDLLLVNSADIRKIAADVVKTAYDPKAREVTLTAKNLSAVKVAIQNAAQWAYNGRKTAADTSKLEKGLNASNAKKAE